MELLEHMEFLMDLEKIMYLEQPAGVDDDVFDEDDDFLPSLMF